MVIAIVQDKDTGKLLNQLTEQGFSVTKLSSTGGFLRSGNTTLLLGVEEERLEALLSIIRETCHRREEFMTQAQAIIGPVDAHIPFPIPVPVGGATVFIIDVYQFIKV